MARIGTSGWSYDHWRDALYGGRSDSRHRLDAYVARFDTVELNASFYRWPRPERFAAWAERLPEGFLFTVKAPRGLSHGARLRDPGRWTARIDAGLAALGTHRGPLLVQLPPDMERDDARLAVFLAEARPEWRVAMELRHPSWVDEDVFGLLAAHGASYCVLSGAHLPCELRATADPVYVRFHGPDPERLYVGGYPDRDLRWWADRIREWEAAGHDVVAYFNNDEAGHAVHDAERLRALLE